MNKTWIRTVTVVLSILAVGLPVFAQGVYKGRAYSKNDVDQIIRRVESLSDAFQKEFDRELDRSALDGTKREDRFNEQVKNFEKALDRLRADFDRQDSWWESRNNVRSVRDESANVNGMFTRRRFGPVLERAWGKLKRDLNKLFGVYQIEPLR